MLRFDTGRGRQKGCGKKTYSSVELNTGTYWMRSGRRMAALHAYLSVDEEGALRQAAAGGMPRGRRGTTRTCSGFRWRSRPDQCRGPALHMRLQYDAEGMWLRTTRRLRRGCGPQAAGVCRPHQYGRIRHGVVF